jgi:antitoxin component YwqK of YwqJK toxin-antitoxin module
MQPMETQLSQNKTKNHINQGKLRLPFFAYLLKMTSDKIVNKIKWLLTHTLIKKYNEKYWIHSKTGKKDGVYKKWYLDGKIWLRCFFKDGYLDGEYTIWRDDGQICQHCFYKKDKIIKYFFTKSDNSF